MCCGEKQLAATALILAMARLTKVSTDRPSSELRSEFESFLKERGNVPNMFRTAAHRPEIMKTMTAHFRAVMNTGTVPKKLKEIVAVRVSHLNACEY
jgi:alkylhydroperoxidase family enzyme